MQVAGDVVLCPFSESEADSNEAHRRRQGAAGCVTWQGSDIPLLDGLARFQDG